MDNLKSVVSNSENINNLITHMDHENKYTSKISQDSYSIIKQGYLRKTYLKGYIKIKINLTIIINHYIF